MLSVTTLYQVQVGIALNSNMNHSECVKAKTHYLFAVYPITAVKETPVLFGAIVPYIF